MSNKPFTIEDYIKRRVQEICDGTIQMHRTPVEMWPITPEEFDKAMNLVNVLLKTKRIYEHSTYMILELFTIILSYNPMAPLEDREKHKEIIRETMALVKKVFSYGKS